jgi:GT2 family glycosyltransferase
VVIVHYPSAADLVRCLDLVSTLEDRIASVTVVDNASPEGIPGALSGKPAVNVIRAGENMGFARAANVGARVGSAPLLLFLNPDVQLQQPTLDALVAALANGRIAAAAPRLVLPDGQPQVGGAGCFPTVGTLASHAFQTPTWLPGQWSKRSVFLSEAWGNGGSARVGTESARVGTELAATLPPRVVDWVSGACMLIHRGAFENIGGFDERFFMYGEDLDLCLRLHNRGHQVAYCPAAEVEHGHLAFKPPAAARAPADTWLKGLDQFYRLHRPWSRRIMHFVLGIGFALRAIAYGTRLARPRSSGDKASQRMVLYARRAFRLGLAR